MKAFISYSSVDKKHGGAIRTALAEIDVDPFLAHDDVRVSEAWEKRILEELAACHVFVPLLSKAFKASIWCNQEVGFIVRRRTALIVPISLDGTKPYGFFSHVQSHKMPASGLDPETVLHAIGGKWPSVVIAGLLKPVAKVYSFRAAEEVVKPLVSYFPRFTAKQANVFAQLAAENGQIWGAHLCRDEYLPAFLRLNKERLKPSLYRALKQKVGRE